jgi:hypothetical protein
MSQQDALDLFAFMSSVIVGLGALGLCGLMVGVSFTTAALVGSLLFAASFVSLQSAIMTVRLD